MKARATRAGDIRGFTRRTHGRENRLRTSPKTDQIIKYLLAVYTSVHDIELNAITYLGNHEHGVAHDPNRKLPEFFHDLHELITLHLNAVYGDEGSIWDSRQTNLVEPVTPEDVLWRIAYTSANPVKHQQVRFAKDYPGIRMRWPCEPEIIERPEGFLDAEAKREDGSPMWPEKIALEMHRPRGFEHLTDDELAAFLDQYCEIEEDRQRKEVLDKGGAFLGRRNVRRRSRYYRARTPERRRRLIPRVACKDETLRKQAIARRKAWEATYDERFERWRAGDRDVVFPEGTYQMRVVHGVNVAPPPT